MAKRWYKSKTLWFNAACAGLTAAEASLGVLQPLLPVSAYGTISVVLAVGNAMLRVVTSQGVTK